MNPKSYESLAAHHIDHLRREAAGGQRVRSGQDRRSGILAFIRRSLKRVRSAGRRAPLDVARPRGDLGTP